jgi:hypothetical protein
MEVMREEQDYIVYCCRRCTEIAHVPTVQVRVLPRGRARARYALGEQQKQRPYVRPADGLRTPQP